MINTVLIILAIFAVLLTWYAVWGREWLKQKSWAQGFFEWIEPIEIALYKKSETILFARLKTLSGIVLMLLTQLGEINLTPLMPFVPEKYQGQVNFLVNLLPLAISIMGIMDEKLRNKTSRPIELVAVPEAAKSQPVVAEAIAQATAAKEQAIAVIKDKVI